MRTDNTTATIYNLLISVANSENEELKDEVITALEDHISLLDKIELEVLQEFKQLCEEVCGIPKVGTLVARNQTYQNSPIIDVNSLMDYVNIFISNKKNIKMHSTLLDGFEKYTTGKINYNNFCEVLQNAAIIGAPEVSTEVRESNLDEEFYERLAEESEEIEGIHFGIPAIDELYRGLLPNELLTIAGYTGSMKTTLAANLVYNAATLGKNTLFICLEMRKEDISLRLLSRHSMSSNDVESVTVDMLTKEGYPKKNKEVYKKLVADYMSLPGVIRIIDEGDMETYSRSFFDRLIKEVNEELITKTGHGIDIILLDHVQLLKFADKVSATQNPYLVVNYYVSYFREKAAREDYAVILLAQTSRDGYKDAVKNKGRYLASGIAEGNEIERASTAIVTTFLADNGANSGEITVDLIKNRFGPKMDEPKQAPLLANYYMIGTGNANKVETTGPVFDMGEKLSAISPEDLSFDDIFGE